MTIREGAKQCGCSPTTFKAHILPSLRVVRIGRRVFIPEAEIARWLEEHAEEYAPAPRGGRVS